MMLSIPLVVVLELDTRIASIRDDNPMSYGDA